MSIEYDFSGPSTRFSKNKSGSIINRKYFINRTDYTGHTDSLEITRDDYYKSEMNYDLWKFYQNQGDILIKLKNLDL